MQKPALPYIGQKSRLKKELSKIKKSNKCKQTLHSQKTNSDLIQDIDGIDFSKYKCSKIFTEIVKLTLKYGTNNHSPRYSEQLKLFAYSIYCVSPSAYRSFKKQFRLPSERCLRKSFEKKVKKNKNNLTQLKNIKNSIPRNFFLFRFSVPCTLIVDAFSISAISPFNKIKYTDKAKNNCFLFLIAPHLSNYPIFPVYLYESDSGISNEYTQSCIDDIIKVMGETPYKIKYCSVDGDPGYTNRFTKHFDLIFQSILEDDDEKAFKIIEEILGFQIGDFLHFLKKGRSKILDKKIVINPESIEDFLDFSLLINDEFIFNYLKDKSTLGKMRDEYAIDLFNFEICLYIYTKYSATTFIYFLIFSLWCESILNPLFLNQTRIYFLTIVYEFFKSIIKKYDQFEFNSQVKLKKGDSGEYVFFFPKHKIQRIINTLIVTIFEIKYSKDIIGLNRYGSHCIENFIGRIRMLCKSDNRFSTILHNLARYQLITYQSFEHYIVFNKRHQNPGGVQTRPDGSIFDEEINPKIIVKELLALIKLEKSEDENIIFNFVKKLNEFTNKNPLKKLKIPQKLRSIGITNRYFHTETQTEKVTEKTTEKEWNLEEIQLIDQFLLSNRQKALYKLLKKFNCSKIELEQKVVFEKEKLSRRAWTREEDQMIMKNISGSICLKDLRIMLICRTNEQITARKNEIKKAQTFYINLNS